MMSRRVYEDEKPGETVKVVVAVDDNYKGMVLSHSPACEIFDDFIGECQDPYEDFDVDIGVWLVEGYAYWEAHDASPYPWADWKVHWQGTDKTELLSRQQIEAATGEQAARMTSLSGWRPV